MILTTTYRLHRSAHMFTPLMAENLRRFHDFHPEWNHEFFDYPLGVEFVTEEAPEYVEFYQHQPVDEVRLGLLKWLLLQRRGGFWFDIPFRLEADLSALCEAPVVLAFEPVPTPEAFAAFHRMDCPSPDRLWKLADWALGISPDHWLMDAVLDICVERANLLDGGDPSEEDISFVSGAAAFNAACQMHWDRLQKEAVILPLPPASVVKSWPQRSGEADRLDGPKGRVMRPFGTYGAQRSGLNTITLPHADVTPSGFKTIMLGEPDPETGIQYYTVEVVP